MRKLNHPTRAAARRELMAAGCDPLHTNDGTELWETRKKPRRRYRIGREVRPRSEAFHIIEVTEETKYEMETSARRPPAVRRGERA